MGESNYTLKWVEWFAKEWAEMQKPELTAANNEAEKQNDE